MSQRAGRRFLLGQAFRMMVEVGSLRALDIPRRRRPPLPKAR